jgi:predicted enzyme related to lactoylglutathione lyase
MTEQTLTTGTFCWNELATGDVAAAKAFYTQVFGWTTDDMPMPGDAPGTYTLFKLGDAEIAGCYQLDGPQFEGVPPHWMSYVSVKDVDATAAKAQKAGATVLWPAMDVEGIGRMAGLVDPQGAAFAAYKGAPGKSARPNLGNAIGNLCWNELATSDLDGATEFYRKVFGWTADQKSEGPVAYTEWKNRDEVVCGMRSLEPGSGTPPNWTTYVSVEDCDATLSKATELGARVMMPAFDIPMVGRLAVISDPTGGHIAFITLSDEHHDKA